MKAVVPVCFPAADVQFGQRVRTFVYGHRWHLDSPEGVALLQALLRESYPMATVIPGRRRLSADPEAVPILDVYRDGLRGGATNA
jgi:hypothetical protein